MKLSESVAKFKHNASTAGENFNSGCVESGIEAYKMHLNDTKTNPTLGLIVNIQDFLYQEASDVFQKSLSTAEKNPEVKVLKDELAEKNSKLYPKTQKIREFIVEQGRIDSESVKKRVCRYNRLDRLKIALRK